MKRLNILYIVAILLLSSCTKQVVNPEKKDSFPSIFPDYIGVTIPVDIAPMNFNVLGPDEYSMADEYYDAVDVVVKGSKAGELHVQGDYADFDIDEWHDLTRKNEGGQLNFVVCVLKDGKWTQYKEFAMYVCKYHLDDYGLTYRRIAPGYESSSDIGIYQRDIHTFDEGTIFHGSAIPGECLNCHTANRCSSDLFLMHVRGDKGGTVIQKDGKQTWLNTRTDSTKANCSYSYWHHSGNYIVSSVNEIKQLFYTGKDKRIEAFDTWSDILAIDARTNELILCPLLQTDDLETYPVFSVDGKTVYFCSSKPGNIPSELNKIKYSLCKISFDDKNGKFGDHVDTLINARDFDKSITFPRPSYDGRWLMYSVSDYGNFPVFHKESDLWIMDLKTGKSRPLTEVNSDDCDSFHNWSSNGHWFVFSSRRGDGLYVKPYFSCIDDKGNVTKPFVLPQRNPMKHYHEILDSYNCPDFTSGKVDFDARYAGTEVMENRRVPVKIK